MGGKTEAGEGHEAALARELREELGIEAAIGDRLMSVDHQYRDFSLTMHCHLATIVSGAIHLAEHLDARWLGSHEIDSVDWAPADLPVVERVRGMLG